MKFWRLFASILLLALVATQAPGRAQLRLVPVAEQAGEVGLGLMLRKLNTVGIFMHTAAHPDDENNALLAMMSHGKGIRTVLATATRGDGGQNEIGAELFDALAILRTEELLAAHRFDGAEQLFARAVDFGYSFSVEETFQKWGRREILSDYVRLIRSVRPDVIVSLPPEGTGGGLHHQASALLTAEAFRLAADAGQFPEQIAEGLRPWQPKKLYQLMRFGFRGEPPPPAGVRLLPVAGNTYDPMLGRTYMEVGTEGRSMHKCQGMAQLLALPANNSPQYKLADTTIAGQTDKDEAFMFDGVDATIPGLAQHAGSAAPAGLTAGLAAISREAQNAMARFEAAGTEAAVAPIFAGLAAVRQLRAQLGSLGLSEIARYEIDYRLAAKEAQFQDAALLAQGVRLEALADDGLVIEGQDVKVTTIAANRGAGSMTVRRVSFKGLEGQAKECAQGQVASNAFLTCDSDVKIGAGLKATGPYFARLRDAARYAFEPDVPFGAPFRPTPFRAVFDLEFAGGTVTAERIVVHRYQRDIFSGEKRMELKIVPRFALRTTPEIAVLPAAEIRPAVPQPTQGGAAARGTREVRVTVTNNARGAATGEATIEVPAGWTATPARAAVAFTREDEEQTLRFAVKPSATVAPGEYRIRATVMSGAQRFDRGYQVIEYPHISRRHIGTAPETLMKVLDVKVAPGLLIGYIMGVGDQVPSAIEQLGARVEQIDADELAWGDLSRYHAIVTGVRAYERREDLRAHNDRLLKYAESGGTVIVQYNKTEFNEAQYGPYPAKVTSNRITDENTPVQILTPEHPVFSSPNKITDADWKNWVQERGIYFLGNDKDAHYVDLMQMEDGFEHNKGVKRGALVEARTGKGRWIYVGLVLWRQLPAGTNGAFPLLANLISLGKTKPGPATQANLKY